MKNPQNQSTEQANGSVVAAETPKQEAVVSETKIKPTPVNERLYKIVKPSTMPFKGPQRQIVYDALAGSSEPMSVDAVVKIATAKGLRAVGGIGPSCRYHLHHLVLLGFVEVTNPTTTIVIEKKAETKAA